MGELIYFQHKRVERILKHCAAKVVLATTNGALTLNIGPQLKPDMGLVLTPEGFSCTLSIKGQPQAIEAPWSCVMMSDYLTPPPRGGTPAPAVAVAA